MVPKSSVPSIASMHGFTSIKLKRNVSDIGGTSPCFYTRLPPSRRGPKAPKGGGGDLIKKQTNANQR